MDRTQGRVAHEHQICVVLQGKSVTHLPLQMDDSIDPQWQGVGSAFTVLTISEEGTESCTCRCRCSP